MKIASRGHYADHMASVPIDGLDVALVASYADVLKAQRTRQKRIVLMQHGIGQSYGDRNPAYPGGRGNDAVGLFLTPGEHPAQRWRSAYPKARVEIVGTPLLDDLPRREPDGQVTVAVTFHWLKHAFPFFRDAVVELAKDVHVIGHGHPRNSTLPRFWRRHDIEHVPDFMDVCRRADLLVFDNTSAGYLFAATGRPVVVMNGPDYKREWDYGLRFWDASHVGVQAVPPGLGTAVSRALELWPDDVALRENALDRVFAYRSGAAQRTADVIREWVQ